MATGNLRIERVALRDLRRWPSNPKRHELLTIERSIGRFGFVTPPMIDERTGRLVAGHGRVEALEAMRASGAAPPARVTVRKRDGEWMVPVLRGVEFDSEDDARAYLLADNRLTELGGWDDAALAAFVREAAGRAGDVGEFLAGTGMEYGNRALVEALGPQAAPLAPPPGKEPPPRVPMPEGHDTRCPKCGLTWRRAHA